MTVRLATILLIVAGTAAWAVDLAPTPDELMIPRLPVTVDGDLGEWDLDAYGYTIDPERAAQDPAIVAMPNDPGNPLTSAADLSGRVALAWDETHLYVAGEVTDDDRRGIKPGSAGNVGPPGWACDSVMLQIHSFRRPMTTNSPFTDSPNLNLRYEVRAGGRGQLVDDPKGALDLADAYWKLTEHSVLATRETPTGYIVEAAVPWADLGYEAQAGEVLRACFLLGDIDTGEKLTQLGWNFAGEPRQRPVFRLQAAPEATALLSLSTSRPQAGQKWSVRYRVDAREGEITIAHLALLGAQGEVAGRDIGVAVPAGQTASDVLVFEAMPGDAGPHEVRLTVTAGGRTVAEPVERYELVPGPEPAPLIANAPGELRHMRPDRVDHSAYMDHRDGTLRHGFVTDRSGYEMYIRTHVADYLDQTMEYSIEHGDPHIAGRVLQSYAVFRVTGDPRYADWVRRGLEVAIANQRRALEPGALMDLIEVRWHIWQADPNTELAPPNIERDFQELWAQAAVEFDEGWMFGEWGYHNRCWHRLCIAKVAKFFADKLGKPVDPRIEEYIAWHQPLYDRFGYTTDNSSGYHWVGERYPVWWHMATGTLEEFAAHPQWQAALERWRRYASPSGALPNFGDTSGWNTGAGEALAAYEMMGRLTGDGRYRWQAHRIAEYLYNHFWPRHNQYHGPRDFTATGFCRAWLFADDSVAPEPAEQNSEVTFRTRIVEPSQEEMAARPGWSGAKLTDEQIPDKLILTSGNDPQRLWGLVELLPDGGHCGQLPGHIATLMVHDAALLAGQGYYERSQDFNNVVWIEDLEGLAADPRPLRTQVPAFVDDPAVTYARIVSEPYGGLPVTSVRDIVFVKNGFVLVKDRITFHADMKVRVGPCWQTRDLGPQCGQDWFNAYYEWVYFTGLGLGKGVHAYRNPAWDLLVRFAPRADTRITVLDRYEDNPYRTSGTQLRQSWSGIARAGETRTFTTILLPHPPEFDVTGQAERARFIEDTDGRTLVHVTVENDNQHQFTDQYWVLLQEEPGMANAEGFVSDARLAVVPIDREGTVRPAVLVGGASLALNNQDLAASARRPQLRSIFEIAGEGQ